MEDLMLYNPYEDYDDYLVVDKPKRRRRRSNPSSEAEGGMLLTLALALGGWLLWHKNKHGRFPWQPAPVSIQRHLAAAPVAKKNPVINDSYKVIMPKNEKYDGESWGVILP
jgi:hypothetical protein